MIYWIQMTSIKITLVEIIGINVSYEFYCELVDWIYQQTSSHKDCIQKVSPLCEVSYGSVTAMILRMFSDKLCNESSCSVSAHA